MEIACILLNLIKCFFLICETWLCRYAQTDMMKLANRMQFGIPEESSLGQLAFTPCSLCHLSYNFSIHTGRQLPDWHNHILLLYQVMAWGKVMACSDRQEVASCVSQLDKTNLLLKWRRSVLPLFFIDYDILHRFVIFKFYGIILYQ